ncbi:MAG: glutamate synthase large subunit [Alistipes sp.]|nr:glutamate synthase large subunit [Alistipes sp.]
MENKCLKRGGGLYDPSCEHDACGVGLVVNIKGGKYHEVVENGLCVLEHMAHRGAEGADNKTGDGAGIMVQIPHEFILLNGIPVPEKGRYGVGMLFFPRCERDAALFAAIVEEAVAGEGLSVMHTRDVPVDSSILGREAAATEPAVKQVFIVGCDDREELEQRLYTVRKVIERRVAESEIADRGSCYVVSLSTRTLVYKGMLSSLQLRHYFKDLTSPYFTSAIAIVHSRFSTNTFPTWSLAQPFRMIGHNGEINTIRGNRLWMHTREAVLQPEGLGDMASQLSPIVEPGMSDSASFDNALEFFVRSGLSLPHALAMLIPESYNAKNPISDSLKGFYEYHSIFMEPWDGPAAVLFSDGRYAGGMLDRNGLRPARWLVTKGGTMVVASETGVLDIDPSQIESKGRLRPGKILMVDTERGEILTDEKIKSRLASQLPYREWLHKNRVILREITSGRHVKNDVPDFARRLEVFGYSREDIDRIIKPMAVSSAEPTASMGSDIAPAVLASKPQRFFNYFRQQFAQVTNPPIDPIREELVMSLTSYIGAVTGNILSPSPELCKVVKLDSPIISNSELDILRNIRYKGFKTITLPLLFDPAGGTRAMEQALDDLCMAAERAVDEGYNYVVVSDRDVSPSRAPIPSLLALSAVHRHLIARRKRTQIAIIVESAEVCEVMHVALLVGYGASGVNPYMAFAVLDDLVRRKEIQLDYATAESHYIAAINKGILKIMSKMGISTIRSYRGAALFEAVGVGASLLDRYMGGGMSKIGGIDLDDLTRDAAAAHSRGFAADFDSERTLENFGIYAWRRDGEPHAWTPQIIKTLQEAVRTGDRECFDDYCRMADSRETPLFLRDMMEIRSDRAPVDVSQVEPAADIARRFVVGAMSFGAISKEAHETIAIAMNRIGCQSNTGEGGEDSARIAPLPNGDSARSAVKQIASGRFGVDAEYLVNADEIQIKVAQGAKPGEGGQLPGFKVDRMIARTRNSIPGISLISPPPHHDIYSIEDLAQLIFDLKNINPSARISVKLVSESGVGTIAAGVAKTKADMILISGCEGGTGASPAGSIRHAGLPLEIGLAEIQQTLVMNDLRGKVRLQIDGQLKTGRDVVVGALLGAEEFGFATAALIVLGCKMLRQCHSNTCPMGVATQNEELRKRFAGRPEHLVNYFMFMAEQVRETLAGMGYTRLDDIVGRADLLRQVECRPGTKAAKIDLSRLLHRPDCPGNAIRNAASQEHGIDSVKDVELLRAVGGAVESRKPIAVGVPICNTDRSVGAMLSGHVTRMYGRTGLPEDTVDIAFRGSAGQSFGAFLARGVTFRLEGDANDYLGKGLSGGRIVVTPPHGSEFAAGENIIAGNTLLYGATSGEVYINGCVGERFCVRNSGAVAVVEGVGDHGCEYMTGGRVVVLGPTGRNFAAGMSGGVAYVWNRSGDFDYYCNMNMVELTLLEDRHDCMELKMFVERHYRYTGSAVAARMLEFWDDYVDQFIKVMPIEYKRVLHEEKLAELNRRITGIERDY